MSPKQLDVRETLPDLLGQLLPGGVDLIQPGPEQFRIARETRVHMWSRDDPSDPGRHHALDGFEGLFQ